MTKNSVNIENYASNMPSLTDDFEMGGLEDISNAFPGLENDTAADDFVRDLFGPSNGQTNSTFQTRRFPKTTTGVDAETIEKMLKESKYLKSLSENHEKLTQNQAKLMQNQEKILEGQKYLDSILKVILNELRHGTKHAEDNTTDDQSLLESTINAIYEDTSNQRKRTRHSEASSEAENARITRSKKPKTEESLNTNKMDFNNSATKIKEYLNTDKNLYFNNFVTKICVFCKKRYEKIVHHYRTFHSLSEVIASRLSQEMVDQLENNRSKPCIITKGTEKLVRADCAFCEEKKAFSTFYWPNHVRTHTGEYKYRCVVCSLTVAYSAYHCNKKARNTDNFRLDEEDLTLHLCLECNYVQIEKTNIIQHLKTQHKFNDEILESKYKMITMISIKNLNKTKHQQALAEEVSNQTTSQPEGKMKFLFCNTHPSRNFPVYQFGIK